MPDYAALDEVRFFWDGADVINMVISLCRRQYDPMGNITATVDGVGNRTGYILDKWGRVTEIRQLSMTMQCTLNTIPGVSDTTVAKLLSEIGDIIKK